MECVRCGGRADAGARWSARRLIDDLDALGRGRGVRRCGRLGRTPHRAAAIRNDAVAFKAFAFAVMLRVAAAAGRGVQFASLAYADGCGREACQRKDQRQRKE